MKRILFQGDSITDVGRSYDNNSDMGHGYPTLTAARLGCEEAGEVEFFNRGISGNRIVDVYARIKSDIINLKPDVMSILIGVNDVWHEFAIQNGVDAEKYYKIYSMLIEEIKAELPDIKILILEPFVEKHTATEEKYDAFRHEVEKRAEKAKLVAEKYNLKFVPLQDKFDEALNKAPVGFWTADGVHPTTAGHQIISNEWIKAYKSL